MVTLVRISLLSAQKPPCNKFVKNYNFHSSSQGVDSRFEISRRHVQCDLFRNSMYLWFLVGHRDAH